MVNIIQFVPKHKVEASDNLREFIRMCKHDLTVFGGNLNWDSHHWPTPGITFGNIDNYKGTSDSINVIRQPLLEFAKAYLRYQQGMKPVKNPLEVRAFKCIEPALIQMFSRADIADINSAVLDLASEVAKEHYTNKKSVYQAGAQIQKLATFISNNHLVANYLGDWKHGLDNDSSPVRTGSKAKAEHDAKLPDPEALHAIADVFASNPKIHRDIFTSSIVAMLLCAPSRISEILSLPVNCEHYDQTGKKDKTYGWRFIPSKDGEPMIKWIPDAMLPIAKEAIKRIRELTQEAREIAVWYEQNPNLFYRHKNCPDVDEHQPLSIIESGLALGLSIDRSSNLLTQLRRFGASDQDGVNTLSSLMVLVRNRQPEKFPIYDDERNLKYSESRFCLQLRQLDSTKVTSTVLLWKATADTVNEDLSSIEKSHGNFTKSIFDRHGYNIGRSQPLELATHEPRHLLNTMAQRGKLSQSEIARWSGRADVKQNRVYDHMSEFELVEMLREHDTSLTLAQPLEEIAEQIAQQLPMSRHEFNTLAIPNAHITEYGFCIQDFVMNPCTRFADCINCTEQVCIKGDRRLALMKEHHGNVQIIIKNAEQEIADGTAGADRWYEMHVLTEKRMANLIDILENPDIPNGSIIKLRNENEFNPMLRAIESRLGKQTSLKPFKQQLLETQLDLQEVKSG
jgi:hypothetical protein